jgi:hypothetical protein
VLYIQAFAPLPATVFFLYIGYYSFKVLSQKKIPPNGNAFPFSIPKVTYRDHYTFGIAGIFISLFLIYIFIKNVYFTYTITNI